MRLWRKGSLHSRKERRARAQSRNEMFQRATFYSGRARLLLITDYRLLITFSPGRNATLLPRRGRRKTTCGRWGSARSRGNYTSHWKRRPGTGAPSPEWQTRPSLQASLDPTATFNHNIRRAGKQGRARKKRLWQLLVAVAIEVEEVEQVAELRAVQWNVRVAFTFEAARLPASLLKDGQGRLAEGGGWQSRAKLPGSPERGHHSG